MKSNVVVENKNRQRWEFPFEALFNIMDKFVLSLMKFKCYTSFIINGMDTLNEDNILRHFVEEGKYCWRGHEHFGTYVSESRCK